MTRSEFYRAFEEIVEAQPGTIHGDETLKDLEGWSSLAVITFIAMVDEKLGATVSAQQMVGCQTVPDLLGLLAGRITE